MQCPPSSPVGAPPELLSSGLIKHLSYYDLVDTPRPFPPPTPKLEAYPTESECAAIQGPLREARFLEMEAEFHAEDRAFSGSSPCPNQMKPPVVPFAPGRMTDAEQDAALHGPKGSLKWEAPPGIDISSFLSRGLRKSLLGELKESWEEECTPSLAEAKPLRRTSGKKKPELKVRVDQRDFWSYGSRFS